MNNCKGSTPVKLSVWYMHDNHTFTRLAGTLDEIVDAARQTGNNSPWGMLGPARLLDANAAVVRTIGEGIHARPGFAESDLLAFREALLADADAVRLLERNNK